MAQVRLYPLVESYQFRTYLGLCCSFQLLAAFESLMVTLLLPSLSQLRDKVIKSYKIYFLIY